MIHIAKIVWIVLASLSLIFVPVILTKYSFVGASQANSCIGLRLKVSELWWYKDREDCSPENNLPKLLITCDKLKIACVEIGVTDKLVDGSAITESQASDEISYKPNEFEILKNNLIFPRDVAWVETSYEAPDLFLIKSNKPQTTMRIYQKVADKSNVGTVNINISGRYLSILIRYDNTYKELGGGYYRESIIAMLNSISF